MAEPASEGHSDLQGVQGRDLWNVGNTDCTDSQTPYAGRSPEQQTQPPAFIIFPVDAVDMHPGCHGEDTVVRFTAPLSGNYRLRGSIEGINECCPKSRRGDFEVKSVGARPHIWIVFQG